MSRSLFLSNGNLMVGLDEFGQIHDLYYPYVGQGSHTNERTMAHRIGIWIDGQMSWLDNGDWKTHIDYNVPYMESVVDARNAGLGISIHFSDFIDCDDDILIRDVTIANHTEQTREIKLFMHQHFAISEQKRGDTAIYVPDGHYVLDYRGRICFGISMRTHDSKFDQFSVGLHGIEGRKGTYVDAEDGELEGNAVEHGSVDSILRQTLLVPAHGSQEVSYSLAASTSHHNVHSIEHQLDQRRSAYYRYRTRNYWSNWISPALKTLSKMRPLEQQTAIKSLLIIKSHIDDRGGILASGDSEMLNYARDNYSYCWPRDGAYVLRPLVELGLYEDAKHFFDFVADTLADNGSVMHKYQPDRSIGSTWHPLIQDGKPELAIQEDETAIIIIELERLLTRLGNESYTREMYDRLVMPAANFLADYIDRATGLCHPSYDLWEQKFATFTYTVGTVYGALKAASSVADSLGDSMRSAGWDIAASELRLNAREKLINPDNNYFYKSYSADGSDDTIDSSAVYGALQYGIFEVDEQEAKSAINALEDSLLDYSPSGGLPRYTGDGYFNDGSGANPWHVCTQWLAQLYITAGRDQDAERLITWTREKTTPAGVLSEQIHPITSTSLGVAPLIWSQAELLQSLVMSQNKRT